MRGGNCQRFWDNSGVGEESIAFYPLAEKDVFFENTFPASSLQGQAGLKPNYDAPLRLEK